MSAAEMTEATQTLTPALSLWQMVRECSRTGADTSATSLHFASVGENSPKPIFAL